MANNHAAAPKRRTGRIVFISLAVVLVVVAGAAALYTLILARNVDGGRTVVENVFAEESERPEAPEPDSEAEKAQTILLVGSDSRGEISDDLDEISGTRSDAIMVMHIPAERDGVYVMSLMRDTWVPTGWHGKDQDK